ncbi:MAG: hypothetical protein ACTSPR_08865 [Candidatus Thorarchaeota archaeon]
MIVILLALPPTEYPSPFGLFWIIFNGSDSLLASATGSQFNHLDIVCHSMDRDWVGNCSIR